MILYIYIYILSKKYNLKWNYFESLKIFVILSLKIIEKGWLVLKIRIYINRFLSNKYKDEYILLIQNKEIIFSFKFQLNHRILILEKGYAQRWFSKILDI